MERLDECKAEEETLKARLIKLENELNQLENQTIDAEILRQNLDNFLTVFRQLQREEQREFLSILIKEILYDGENKRVRIKLRPLPAAWSKLDVLEGLFDYHQRTLPGSNAKRNYFGQRSGSTQIIDAIRNRNPSFDPYEEFSHILSLSDPSMVDAVGIDKGLIQILAPKDAFKIKSQQRRYQLPPLPRPPAIQFLLKSAYRLNLKNA